MAPIYSKQLANAVYSPGGLYTAYTVPTGATLVLTDIDVLWHDSASAQTSYITIGSCLLLYHLSTAAAFVQAQWVGKQVLNAGQTIQIEIGGLGAYFAATGYVLT